MIELISPELLQHYARDNEMRVSTSFFDDIARMANELLQYREQELALSQGRVPLLVVNARLVATWSPQFLQPGCQHLMGHCRCDPPHHLRCDHINPSLQRCTLGSGVHTEHHYRG